MKNVPLVIALVIIILLAIIAMIYAQNQSATEIKRLAAEYYVRAPTDATGLLSVCDSNPERDICQDREIKLNGIVLGIDEAFTASGAGFRQQYIFDEAINISEVKRPALEGIKLCLDRQHRLGCTIPGQSPSSSTCNSPLSEGEKYTITGVVVFYSPWGPCLIVETWKNK
ncbi:MAG TPA: hypothetical protein VJK07_01360 [Candidatus Nanoarchaeia archaeon]|nr:hypothetical protein [Candidatus Nanoarchaeia archaeon]